jgi:hypothetical protein
MGPPSMTSKFLVERARTLSKVAFALRLASSRMILGCIGE